MDDTMKKDEDKKTPIQIKESFTNANFANVVRVTPIQRELVIDFGLETMAKFSDGEKQIDGRQVNFDNRIVLSLEAAYKLKDMIDNYIEKKEENE